MSKEIVELLRDRAMVGRMEVRDKQLMLKAADEIEAGYGLEVEETRFIKCYECAKEIVVKGKEI